MKAALVTSMLILSLFAQDSNATRRPATPTLKILFEDQEALLSYREVRLLKQNVNAAFMEWAKYFNSGATVVAMVRFTNQTVTRRVDCASSTNIYYHHFNDSGVYEESAAYKLRTGRSVTEGEPDLLIQIDPEYYYRELWLDPRPERRVDYVPNDKVDAVSVLTHELGHAFGFQSFRNLTTGEPAPGFLTRFDERINVSPDGFFYQSLTMGDLIPLTSSSDTQNIRHLANSVYDPLASDLMNGVSFFYGWRYHVSKTDLGIMKDLGLPMKNNRGISPAR